MAVLGGGAVSYERGTPVGRPTLENEENNSCAGAWPLLDGYTLIVRAWLHSNRGWLHSNRESNSEDDFRFGLL